MKKLIKILAVSLLLFTFACSKNDNGGGMPNPMVEYESLDAINKKVGCNLIQPGVMGITDEKYYVIADTLAQYNFSLNGYDFTFRASKDMNEDISGVYVGNGTLFSLFDSKDPVNITGEGVKGYRFFTDDTQYTIIADQADDLDEMKFVGLCEEIMSIIAAK